jgi:hypothetical protein
VVDNGSPESESVAIRTPRAMGEALCQKIGNEQGRVTHVLIVVTRREDPDASTAAYCRPERGNAFIPMAQVLHVTGGSTAYRLV